MQNRHILGEVMDESTILVRSLGLRLASKHQIRPHCHRWHQLIYASEGVMTVSTATGFWVVPTHRAVWIPADSEHAVRMTGVVRMRTLYLRPDLGDHRRASCCVITVSPLLRELIAAVMEQGMLREEVPRQARLAGVLIDQLSQTGAAPLDVRFPQDARARRVADRVHADLAATVTIGELVRDSGASARTIERIFRRETGLTFGRWLQRVKTLHALERLASGDSVTAAALAVGYDSTSAFIVMFKRVLGTTPGRYFRGPREDGFGG